jgi:hypothetical protein
MLGVLPILPKKTCWRMLSNVMAMTLAIMLGKLPGKLGDATQHNEHGLDHSITLVTLDPCTYQWFLPHNCV